MHARPKFYCWTEKDITLTIRNETRPHNDVHIFHFNMGGFYRKIKHILKVSLGTGLASLITWGYSCFRHVHNLMAEPTPDELKFDNL